MSGDQELVTINGQDLLKKDVEGFAMRWAMFTSFSNLTPQPLIDLLAFAQITGETPSEDVLAQHDITVKDFNQNIKFFKHKLAEDAQITAEMRQQDDAKFVASPLYSTKMWNLFNGGEQ
jgi:hypothetical protein